MSIEPLVSVIITTYNQAPYIEQAILGVINQKTKYPFELIIHDDASTDGTSKIVRRYRDLFPEMIVATIQKENLYSRNISRVPYTLGLARGKYLMICEGDDYWSDDNKIELQISFLESHPECSMVCHAYRVHKCINGEEYVVHTLSKDGQINMSDLIHNVIERIPQYATFACRLKETVNMPDFYRIIPMVGDYPYRLYLATIGTIYYIDREMSVYRLGTSGSFTERYSRLETNRKIEIENGYIEFLTIFLGYVPTEFFKDVEEEIDKHKYMIAVLNEEFKSARKNRVFSQKSRKERMLIRIGCCSKKLYKFLTGVASKRKASNTHKGNEHQSK